MAVKIPLSLKKSPLISVSCEIRFDGVEQYNDLFATKIAYSILNEDFSSLTRLPIVQVPEQARANDMPFEPIYGVKRGEADLLSGPKVIISRTSAYKGWDNFCRVILEAWTLSRKYIRKVIRAGFRSVDFFDGRCIDSELNLSLALTQNSSLETLGKECASFAVTYVDGNNRVRLSYSNDAKVIDKGKYVKKGSVIDVDAFCDDPSEEISTVVSELHEIGKRVFFESLKESFVESMEPVYD